MSKIEAGFFIVNVFVTSLASLEIGTRIGTWAGIAAAPFVFGLLVLFWTALGRALYFFEFCMRRSKSQNSVKSEDDES